MTAEAEPSCCPYLLDLCKEGSYRREGVLKGSVLSEERRISPSGEILRVTLVLATALSEKSYRNL